MTQFKGASILLGAAAVLLTSCRPFGCDTDECVRKAPFERVVHCAAVYQAGVSVLRDPTAHDELKGEPNILQAQAMQAVSVALKQGRELGIERGAIYQTLERERLAYLRPLSSRSVPAERYDQLVKDIAHCGDGEDL